MRVDPGIYKRKFMLKFEFLYTQWGCNDDVWLTDTFSFFFGLCPSLNFKIPTSRKPALPPSSGKEKSQ